MLRLSQEESRVKGANVGWFSRKIYDWGVSKQSEEIGAFVKRLSVIDGGELGMVVALATDRRHAFRDAYGIDLSYPSLALGMDRNIAITLGGLIRDSQKQKNYPMAAAFMVWIHTIRACTAIDLRGAGRGMWRQLERGFPYAVDARWNYFDVTGDLLNIEGFDQFPEGLTPDPL